jgi:hypothetical protein
MSVLSIWNQRVARFGRKADSQASAGNDKKGGNGKNKKLRHAQLLIAKPSISILAN